MSTAITVVMLKGMWARGWRRGSFLRHEKTWPPSKRIMRRCLMLMLMLILIADADDTS